MFFGLENSISIEIVSNQVSNTFLFMYFNIDRPETVGFFEYSVNLPWNDFKHT